MANTRGLSTETRILDTAIASFVLHGFSGTRVQNIADEADVNIRMIYHYFGSKKGLFRAALHEVSRRRAALMTELMEDPPRTLPELALVLYDSYNTDSDWVRLLQWETLETELIADEGQWVNADERRTAVADRIQIIRAMQTRGDLDPSIDPAALYVILVGAALAPAAFPATVDSTASAVGGGPDFAGRYRDTLAQVAALITRPAQG